MHIIFSQNDVLGQILEEEKVPSLMESCATQIQNNLTPVNTILNSGKEIKTPGLS